MAKGLTSKELEKLLKQKRFQLEDLEQKAGALEKELAELEQTIIDLGGRVPGGRKEGRGRRWSNPKSVKRLILEILAASRKGLTLEALTAQIIASGYKTTSEKFNATVYMTIYQNRKLFAFDRERGVYKLISRPKSDTAKP